MILENFLNQTIIQVLQEFRNIFPILEYSKIEEDEFLKVPELGFYLQSTEGNGLISSYRIYLQPLDEYLSLNNSIENDFKNLKTLDSVIEKFGKNFSEIPSIQIPTLAPTLNGIRYEIKDLIISFHYKKDSIVYIHVEK